MRPDESRRDLRSDRSYFVLCSRSACRSSGARVPDDAVFETPPGRAFSRARHRLEQRRNKPGASLDPTRRQRRPAPARGPRARLARPADVAAGRGDVPGDRASLRARRASAPAGPPVLVPVLRGGDGHGLALLRDHHQRHRRAQARASAARGRARASRLRRPGQALAQDAGRAGRHRRARGVRRRGAGARQPAGGQGGQRRGAGRLRPLSARLHRRRRRPLGRGAAGDERRPAPGAPLPLALGGAFELRRRSARGDRGTRAGGDRQPRRPARGALAGGAARAAGCAGAGDDRARARPGGRREGPGRAGGSAWPGPAGAAASGHARPSRGARLRTSSPAGCTGRWRRRPSRGRRTSPSCCWSRASARAPSRPWRWWPR